jgi:shikimate kinase
MGAGKSTVGPLVAARLGLPFQDLDRCVEDSLGMSIATCFERQGEAAFRRAEHVALAQCIEAGPQVLALGGGTLHAAGNRALLNEHFVVVSLLVPWETARLRLGDRPLSSSAERLFAERAAGYLDVAAMVDCADLTPDQVAAAVCLAVDGLR